jgi:hypothetical protein
VQIIAAPVEPAGPGVEVASHSRRVLLVSLLVGLLAGAAVLGFAAQGSPRRPVRP